MSTEQNTHILPKEIEHDPDRIHGRVVRVHNIDGKPTGFVGVVTSMSESEFGVQCDVSGAGRRMCVLLALLAPATVDELHYANVHKPETGKAPMHIDGAEIDL